MIPRNELIQIVAEDIRYLQQEWHDLIPNHALRRGSSVLRRFLADGDLQRAWKASGFTKQPEIIAASLEGIPQIPLDKIIFAGAQGATYKGASVMGTLLVNKYLLTNEESDYLENKIGFPQKNMGLLEFIESPCIITENTQIDRRILVKYVSNQLGGSHYDTNRTRKKKTEVYYPILDRAANYFQYDDKDAIYFELLSIGQAIAKSLDLDKFCHKAGI
jgi:hypothetical protein